MHSFLNRTEKGKLKANILATFRLHRNDSAFLGWINVYTYQIIPILVAKLSNEINEKELKVKILNNGDWFGFWLATKTDEKLNLSFPILNNNFAHFEATELSQYSFDIIVRNIPVFIWMDLREYPMTLILHLAKGNSIRTFKEIVPMSRKMAHLFQNLKYGECRPEDYYACCLVKLMRGSSAFFKMVSPYIRLTNNIEWSKNVLARYEPFLKKLLEWNTVNILEKSQQEKLMGFINHKLHEMNNFSVKGKTLNSLLGMSEEYYNNQLARRPYFNQMKKDAIYEKWTASKYTEWNLFHNEEWHAIFELTDAYELAQESDEMSHCVRDYTTDCMNKECSIWSLRRKTHRRHEWKSLVTIEINRFGGIVQAKGRFNQHPKEEYMKLINDWMKKESLSLQLEVY